MSRNKILCLVALTILIMTTVSCGFGTGRPIENQSFHMGTIITQKVYGKNAGKVIDAVNKKLQEIESKMTINLPGGDVNKLNDMAVAKNGDWNLMDKETIYVLQTAKHISEISSGAFDVTIGPLVKAWGIFTSNPRIPGQDEINSLLKLVDYKDVSIQGNSARLARPGQIVDLGGIAKGYSGDAAIKIYKESGIKSALINLGGNVVVLGNKPDGTPWKIGVQNPRAENGKYIGLLKVTDKAVVSSGDYERFFEKDGKRYHHILDPKTGYPSDSGLIGTTIITDLSIEADSLSTAVFVLGLDRGMKLIESLPGTEAVFITGDKKVYATKGLKDIFTFDDESKEYEYVEKR